MGMDAFTEKLTPDEVRRANRRAAWERSAAAMAEGRTQRAVTFRPKKGPGAYRRRPKHRIAKYEQ